MTRRKIVYLASPLGFAHSTAGFMAQVVDALGPHVDILNPWDDKRFEDEFAALAQEESFSHRRTRLSEINQELARNNTADIDAADGVFAVLDGVDVDSGTAAEIGYAYAKGKRVYGLRTDFRLAGDNLGAIVNLQVQFFIEASGGNIALALSDLVECARRFAADD
ncbi:MAG TPA: nucleoside 2-deoxyribosyltransferase [Thermomicrobiales bacterium]|nr:nucleoside 2-deoxyribosyltransferase [Thermomicrobiales bacterium]